MSKTPQLVQGNAAIAQGAFYAGARFYAGYPITPSSEIAEIASRDLPRLGGVFMQMEDELASMGAIVGASLAGVKAFTATSGPGFSLMQENLGMATIGEVPVVVVNVQRSGPSTGLATKPAQSDIMQLRWGRHGDQEVIALAPATVRECFELTVTAFNLAEKYRVPVILAPEEVAGHMRENLVIPEPGELEVLNRAQPACAPEDYKPFCFDAGAVAPLPPYGGKYVYHVTSSMHGENGYSCNTPANAARRVAQLHTKLARGRDEIVRTRYFGPEDCATLIVASGVVTRAARSAAAAANANGGRVGVLQLQTLWPFADKELAAAARKASRVVVAEMNYAGQLAGEVKKYVDPALVRGVNTYNGSIMTPAQIAAALQ
ncbi:2-oxoacid:acceptor oxidoreductase subunit alpha [Desulfovibrio legallii]|uniref:2-oxoglutarate ferredoxin oxidoreductase subunit alpha n=1 Tax=Desulfovibrio legallii TaxID=571438 RepID=A0A1G7IDT5_9BACT|nr:2-oxoacid:acceptor oxidoreductase subunit alpha [Desulfovibrio legallii]SDF10674.1 2-oxoglutarate ferredoxin oxidoreductase subunit alpha [Desulfovibrio legallii]